MLSFIGELATCSGVGDGSGSAIGSTDDCREFFATTFPAAPLAIANVLSERPKAHANAQVLTATFLKCLGIIPSTGLTDLPPRARSKMPASETFTRAPHFAATQSCLSKVDAPFFLRVCASRAFG